MLTCSGRFFLRGRPESFADSMNLIGAEGDNQEQYHSEDVGESAWGSGRAQLAKTPALNSSACL
ncbi:hypothetical protein PCANC_24577 [Puccinia coronata f. sp. avenae]|uniref:Uncharacterized protein n=1 Tax=Puccinia coronata f. sp. avenae TaxID=200324 RepID=A0A2N5U2W4_9BASI|nr:hypothetical protein PCANC_24577 [Puccinia coronata f. sp. avenae]